MGYKKVKDLPEIEVVTPSDIFLVANDEIPGAKVSFGNIINSMGGLLSYAKNFGTSDFVGHALTIPAAELPFNGNRNLDVQVFDGNGNFMGVAVRVDVGNGDVVINSKPFQGHLIVTGSTR